MSGTIHNKPLTHVRNWQRGERLLANGANGGFNRTHDLIRNLQQGVNQPVQVVAAPHGGTPAAAAVTRTFRLWDATPDDFLLCKELTASGALLDNRERDANGVPIGEIPLVKIAKVRELQRSHQDGKTDNLGRKHVFDGSLLQVVSRGGISETVVIVPPFQPQGLNTDGTPDTTKPGDQIQAREVVRSGAWFAGKQITLMDATDAGRAWTVLEAAL